MHANIVTNHSIKYYSLKLKTSLLNFVKFPAIFARSIRLFISAIDTNFKVFALYSVSEILMRLTNIYSFPGVLCTQRRSCASYAKHPECPPCHPSVHSAVHDTYKVLQYSKRTLGVLIRSVELSNKATNGYTLIIT